MANYEKTSSIFYLGWQQSRNEFVPETKRKQVPKMFLGIITDHPPNSISRSGSLLSRNMHDYSVDQQPVGTVTPKPIHYWEWCKRTRMGTRSTHVQAKVHMHAHAKICTLASRQHHTWTAIVLPGGWLLVAFTGLQFTRINMDEAVVISLCLINIWTQKYW